MKARVLVVEDESLVAMMVEDCLIELGYEVAVVLTGMGADGREGARMLKQGGSQVWAQDEASCVIYGMPMAIVKASLADAVYSLDDIGRHLVEACH